MRRFVGRFVRRAWILINKACLWILPVFILGIIPIGSHLLAVKIDSPKDFSSAIIADAYLYTFIISMTAFTDALFDQERAEKLTAVIGSMLMAVIAGILNLAAQLHAVLSVDDIAKILSRLAYWIPTGTVVVYGMYKIPTLYGAAREEWEVLEKSFHMDDTTSKKPEDAMRKTHHPPVVETGTDGKAKREVKEITPELSS